ncbi:hypothetical protein GWK47_012883 [Chionoecetes opilio]|uniref:Uncharacterized protein n=1 Tax=Chionoecetes opilio TaxID=41210 RepID=A0A8J5CP67_CHIOP|nr:hypothetical protein GWK47_012883 [Chionoecetes opilio]
MMSNFWLKLTAKKCILAIVNPECITSHRNQCPLCSDTHSQNSIPAIFALLSTTSSATPSLCLSSHLVAASQNINALAAALELPLKPDTHGSGMSFISFKADVEGQERLRGLANAKENLLLYLSLNQHGQQLPAHWTGENVGDSVQCELYRPAEQLLVGGLCHPSPPSFKTAELRAQSTIGVSVTFINSHSCLVVTNKYTVEGRLDVCSGGRRSKYNYERKFYIQRAADSLSLLTCIKRLTGGKTAYMLHTINSHCIKVFVSHFKPSGSLLVKVHHCTHCTQMPYNDNDYPDILENLPDPDFTNFSLDFLHTSFMKQQ